MRMGIGLGVGINRSNYAQGIFSAYSARVVADGGVVESSSCVDAVSSLLQSASLLLIPSGYKGGKLYAEIPTNGNGDLTWTRGSDAFRTNASGLIQRLPWNLLQYSEAFDNGVYTKVATTITSNTTTAPNGTLTADKLVSTSVSSSHSIYQNLGSVGDTRVISCFVKKAEYRYITLQYGTASVTFDFDTLTFSGGTSKSYTDEGNGWYRISCLLTATVNARATILIPDNAGNITYVGDGTSGTFIWGFQAVEGTTAQTYLPTTDRLNFPRLSYMYGSCPSVLLEPQRTNLATYSNDFTDATWVKSFTSITANTTTSPDGSTNAHTFTADGTSASHTLQKALSLTSGTTYSISIFAKKGTNNFIQLTASAALFGTNFYANYDLNNGVLGTVGSSATATIVSLSNGWYRCTITGVAIATILSNIAATIISSSTSARLESNSLSTSVFIYGAQLEAGAYPTTYIPTTGSATATRVADSFSRSNIYTNGLISASGGTWFVELRNNIAYTRDAISTSLGIYDVATTNGFTIKTYGGSAQRVSLVKVIGSETSLYATTTDTVKIVFKWNGSTADVFVNGTKQVSATAFTATQLQTLQTAVNTPMFIQAMALYPTPLSDTDCQTLTTL